MKSLITIGTFDGVHRGHQKLLEHLIQRARGLKMKSHVVLFSAPPRFYFQPELATGLLTLEDERIELLKDYGVSEVTALPFNARLARMPHTRFFEEFLIDECRAGGLLVGPDFACGRHRLGNVAWLQYACHERGLFFAIQPFINNGGCKISSSGIRELILQGDMQKAGRFLGRPHFLTGIVVRGRGLGRQIGIPTANLKVSPAKLLPPGVHKVLVTGPGTLGRGRIALCNVGFRPTVDRGREGLGLQVEVHLPKFIGDLYGQELKVEFLRRLRPEKKFASVAELRKQIHADIRRALA